MQQKQKLYIDTGEKFIPVSTNIQKTQLLLILSDNFVPYIECFRKCGKSEICRFTDNLKRQNEDQKCGVIKRILENYLNSTFYIFKKSDITTKQRYLNATTKLIELVIDLEGTLDVIFSKGMVEWFGEWSPALFGGVLRERRTMSELATILKTMKDYHAEINVCLVEGPGDAELFRIFRRYVRVSNYDNLKNIDLLYGKDNRTKGRLDLLIKNYLSRGEKVTIILDGDGSKVKTLNSKPIKKLWENRLIRKKDIFVFKHNIELSFPSEMLIKAVEVYVEHFKPKENITRDQILKAIKKHGDLIERIKEESQLNINKVTFDRILGQLLASVAYENFSNIMERKPDFRRHEIFRFLEFIVKR